MLKRKKPQLRSRRRRLVDVAAGRRRIKRNIAVSKLHQRRRHYLSYLTEEAEAA